MSKHHEPGIDADREWEAQERALRDERMRDTAREDGAGTSGSSLVRSYRVLARVLRQQDEHGLPPDFAIEVARKVREREQAAARLTAESIVVRALGAALMAAIAVFSLANGEQWLALVDFDSTAVQWILAAAGCVGLAILAPGRMRGSHRDR